MSLEQTTMTGICTCGHAWSLHWVVSAKGTARLSYAPCCPCFQAEPEPIPVDQDDRCPSCQRLLDCCGRCHHCEDRRTR